MSLSNPKSALAEAVALFRDKKDAPQARFSARLNQTQTAEAIAMLKKLGVNELAEEGGKVQMIDPGTLLLALLHSATKAMAPVASDNTDADEFVQAILFPTPTKDDADGAEGGKKKAKRPRRR